MHVEVFIKAYNIYETTMILVIIFNSFKSKGGREGVMTKLNMKHLKKGITKNWGLYILLLPALTYVIVFLYGPMSGVLIAFTDYNVKQGIFGSPFAGFKYFQKFLSAYNFGSLIRNTITISTYTLLAGFPLPIIFSLFLNSLNNRKVQNFIKTVSYAPHFISVIVLVSMLQIFFAPTTGVVTNIYNNILQLFGKEPIISSVLTNPNAFPHLYVWSGIWQELGWGSIIYLAALSGISPDLYEAAAIDGATKFQKIIFIDLPGILPTMVILLILNTGNILSVGFEKALLMQNNINLIRSELISTFVYRVGLNNAEYSFSTAIGLFNSAINLAVLLIVNKLANKIANIGIW